MSKRKFNEIDANAAKSLIEKYGIEQLVLFNEYIQEGSLEKAQKLFKETIVNKFNDLPKEVLANILQYLTIGELDVMSKMSRYILETILQYNLKERRSTQGRLYTFGAGYGGRLGDGRINNHTVGIPTLAMGPIGKKITQVSCGPSHTGIITEDGQLYTFGNGQYGRLSMLTDKKLVQVSLNYAIYKRFYLF